MPMPSGCPYKIHIEPGLFKVYLNIGQSLTGVKIIHVVIHAHDPLIIRLHKQLIDRDTIRCKGNSKSIYMLINEREVSRIPEIERSMSGHDCICYVQ